MKRVDRHALADVIVEKWQSKSRGSANGRGERVLIAIAGAPGSGKSTLADSLCVELNKRNADNPAVVLPMDGFHLDNEVLLQRGLLPRKGAPNTFDVDGFHSVLQRVLALPVKQSGNTAVPSTAADPKEVPEEIREEVVIPVFDRSLDLARAGGRTIETGHQLVLVEGNYLLLQSEPWRQLAPLFDLTVMLEVPIATLEDRLIQRWLDHDHSEDQARERAERNDLPNARLVIEESASADLSVAGDSS